MAKRARTRRRYTAKRRTMRNVYVPLNPHKRRSRKRYSSNPRRRHAVARMRRHFRRRNPPADFLGFKLKDVAIAGGAVVVAPFIEKQLMAMLPASLSGTPAGRWAVKIGTAIATGYAAKAVLGQEASRLAFIVLGANLVADAVAQYAPQLTPAAGVGYYAPAGMYVPSGNAGGGFRSLGGGMNGAGPYVGLTGTAGMPVRPGGDPFTPVF